MSRWFRFYAEALDDPKVQKLDGDTFKAWVNLLCVASRNGGTLPNVDDLAFALRTSVEGATRVLDRLISANLLDVRKGGEGGSHLMPHGWDARQFKAEKDASNKCYIYIIGADGADKVKIGFSKNPWARVKEFQTAHTDELRVVATVLTTGNTDRLVHEALVAERMGKGEWFKKSKRIQKLIDEIAAKNIKKDTDLISYVANYVETTTETETDTETEADIREPKGSCASGDALTPDEIVEDWNLLAEQCGLPRVKKLSDARRRRLKVRLREYPDLDDWRTAFNHIRNTPFLLGENREGWRADFDFLLQAKSFTKLTEESYGKAN